MVPTSGDLIAAVNSPGLPVLWPRRYGLVVETPQMAAELRSGLDRAGAAEAFQIAAAAPPFEVALQLEKHHPDILFVEFSRVPVATPDWMQTVCSGVSAPLVIALHIEPDAAQMIAALRAGAVEFLALPLGAGVSDSFERIASLLEARAAGRTERGRLIGIVSAKGGCGATSLACHLAAGLRRSLAPGRILVTDLDYQSSMAHRICRQQCPVGTHNTVPVRPLTASNPGTPGTVVGVLESRTPNTSSRFDAGSVLTSSTRLPPSASVTAVAQAREVFPTPPLPVKNR